MNANKSLIFHQKKKICTVVEELTAEVNKKKTELCEFTYKICFVKV